MVIGKNSQLFDIVCYENGNETVSDVEHTLSSGIDSLISEAPTKDSHILAISGKMGSGKDTIAPVIANHLADNDEKDSDDKPHQAIHLSFADALRAEINEIIGLIRDGWREKEIMERMGCTFEQAGHIVDILFEPVLNDRELTAYEHTAAIREAMQYWGTSVRRATDPDWWVKKTKETVESHVSNGDYVYLTDVRFPNEAEMVRSLNGILIRLEVPEEVRMERIKARDGVYPTREQLDHISETGLDRYLL